jgi:hypothetical protein
MQSFKLEHKTPVFVQPVIPLLSLLPAKQTTKCNLLNKNKVVGLTAWPVVNKTQDGIFLQEHKALILFAQPVMPFYLCYLQNTGGILNVFIEVCNHQDFQTFTQLSLTTIWQDMVQVQWLLSNITHLG